MNYSAALAISIESEQKLVYKTIFILCITLASLCRYAAIFLSGALAVGYVKNRGILFATPWYSTRNLITWNLLHIFSPHLYLIQALDRDWQSLTRIALQGEKDDKIIAVCADDPEFVHYKDIKELPPHRLAEIRRFFEDCIHIHTSS